MIQGMTEEEFWQEEIWYKLQTGEFVECDGVIYDIETGEVICGMDVFQ